MSSSRSILRVHERPRRPGATARPLQRGAARALIQLEMLRNALRVAEHVQLTFSVRAVDKVAQWCKIKSVVRKAGGRVMRGGPTEGKSRITNMLEFTVRRRAGEEAGNEAEDIGEDGYDKSEDCHNENNENQK